MELWVEYQDAVTERLGGDQVAVMRSKGGRRRDRFRCG